MGINRRAQAQPLTVGGCGCSEPESAAARTCYCTVKELVRAIARKHALSVLNLIGANGPMRFTDVESALPRISTSTLSETLHVLENVGLVHREVFPDTPPSVEYSLSEAGELLRQRLRDLFGRVEERL